MTTALPQLADAVFLTDSGLETDLVFSGGWDLPDFAAYPLLDRDDGRAALRSYVDEHVRVARDAGLGIVVETPTWRASSDWGARLGHDATALAALNRRGAQLVDDARRGVDDVPVVVSGCLGPRGDGYVPGEQMTAAQAAAYHRPQVEAFADSPADLVSALTLTGAAEAVGIVRAAGAAGLPVVVSFTVETDGRLPDGTPLGDAVRSVDDATGGAAAYFMVNCAHPDHLAPAVDPSADWWARLRGVRANASRLSHAELDAAPELDAGDPDELARQLADLRPLGITVLGGCCGTDVRHIRALAGEVAGG
jgi:homocysteine S-methyltransferase